MGCSRSKHADGEDHDGEPAEGEELELERFCGKWYVVGSTLPLWRENMRPAMEYTLLQGGGGRRLRDEVTYMAPGKAALNRVLGVDTVVGRGAFVWRGAGLLRLVSSRWRVAYLDPEYRWAISSFQKTLFTPRGVDIIAREPHMPQDLYNALVQKLRDDPHLSFMAEDMFRPQQGELGVGDENVSGGNTPVARFSTEEKGKEAAEPTPEPSPRHPHTSTQPTSQHPPPASAASQPRASRFSASTSEITPEMPPLVAHVGSCQLR
eukprot:jgi/Chlat1/1261/Chrsp115S01688